MQLYSFTSESLKRFGLTIIIGILLIITVFLATSCLIERTELARYREQLKNQQFNTKVVDFSKLFVEKVLKADTEVSFEDRLKLENQVRDLNDPEILAQWEKFTGSTTQDQVQSEVKNLLDLLVKKFIR
jgi:hypothetical protein